MQASRFDSQRVSAYSQLEIASGPCIGNSGTPAFLFPIMWAYKQPRYLQGAGGQGPGAHPFAIRAGGCILGPRFTPLGDQR
jgi:hypothetical protein